jgi:hypothetical protein
MIEENGSCSAAMGRPVLATLHKIELNVATMLKIMSGLYNVWTPALWDT